MNSQRSKKYVRYILICVFTFAFLSGCSELESISDVNYYAESDQSVSVETSGKLSVNVIDVGQGDGIFIKTPNGKNLLIDAGGTKNKAVCSYLNNANISKLDAVVATHPHSDHISELPDIIKDFDIVDFYMPKVMHTSKTFERMIDALEDNDIKPKVAFEGENIIIDEALEISFLAPNSEAYDNLNNYSAVIKIVFNDTTFIFTGDAEKISENEILDKGLDLKADVLKVGHHGSSSSTTIEFLNAINPKYAVISCAENNDYGHPHKETMQKLENIETYITAKDSTVTFISDGKSIDIFTGDNDNIAENNDIATTSNPKTYEEDVTYIGNVNSKKYHVSSCSSLPIEKNRIYLNSKDEAENQGYSACSVCFLL